MITYKALKDYDCRTIQEILKARREAFCNRRRIDHDHLDHDDNTVHMVYMDQNGGLLAYARLTDKKDHYFFSRFVSIQKGAGKHLLEKVLEKIDKPVELLARKEMISYFEKFMFKVCGEPIKQDILLTPMRYDLY